MSFITEHYTNDKILAYNRFNNKISIAKDNKNYYETETNNYNKNLCRYKNILT